MRWRKKSKEYSSEGDTRIITRFLFIPREIKNEYRWLELVKIKQRYSKGKITPHGSILDDYWIDVEWVDHIATYTNEGAWND